MSASTVRIESLAVEVTCTDTTLHVLLADGVTVVTGSSRSGSGLGAIVRDGQPESRMQE